MSDSRTDAAFARIDSALSRIEAQANSRTADNLSVGALNELRKTHEELRMAVSGSLTELDALIADLDL